MKSPSFFRTLAVAVCGGLVVALGLVAATQTPSLAAEPRARQLIAAGDGHTLAVSDGQVYAWGANSDGQLGNDSDEDSSAPVRSGGLTGVVAVAAGSSHSLALTAAGQVYAWGSNEHGQLGDGSTDNREAPVQVEGLPAGDKVVAIAAGGLHTLALTETGQVYAWGFNYAGQLGDGSTDDHDAPVQVSGLPGGDKVVAIAGGSGHSLALTAAGQVYAWGSNEHGQLGDGSTDNHKVPVQVAGLPGGDKVVAIAAGGHHALALTQTGQVYAWGYNSEGQLGDGTRDSRKVPVQVVGLESVNALAAGGFHTLAVTDAGAVYAWGLNWNGQLGDGTNSSRLEPVQVKHLASVVAVAASGHSAAVTASGDVYSWGANFAGQLGDASAANSAAAEQVAGLSDVKAVAAGAGHSLAVTNGGDVWAWGDNGVGQLGDGSLTSSPLPVQVKNLESVTEVSSEFTHSLAVTKDGRVFAWGANYYGQLGDGTLESRSEPVQAKNLAGVKAVAAGDYHSLALTEDGRVFAWGSNSFGQLGFDSPSYAPQPVEVSDLPDDDPVVAIGAGSSFSVALADSGAVFAWGANFSGALGDDDVTLGMSRSEPTEVTGLAGVIAVATGDSHVLALTADGTLWAWGANFDGELGTGASDGFSAVPVQVQGLSGAGEVKTIAAGGDHSLALTAAGQVYTWGANHDGQLGIEDSDQEDTPVPSTALTSVSAIAAGTYYSLAVTSGGDVYTWGENSLGQLGRVPTGWAATQRPASIAVGSRPGVPTEVEVTQGDSQATLTWTAPADDGGAAITGYKVSKDGGTTWETASGTYTHTFTGLTNGQEYDFQVRAVNRVGDGPEEEVSATPTGPPPATEHILMVQAGDGGTIVGPAPTQVVPAGDPVNLEAAANTGYHFAGWTSTNGGTFGDAASLETSFTMPDAATTVTANFAHDPVITVDPLDNETVQAGKSYVRSVLYTYEYGSGPVGFSATGLPSGLSIDQSGLISGAPLTPGTYPIEVTITDGTATGKGTFTLTVQAAPLPTVLELDPLDNGVTRVGVSYSKVPTCRYLNGSGTLVFGASGLPAGLSVNPDSGVISGTPTEPGTFAVTLTLTDGTLSVNRTFTLTVAALYQLTVEDGEGSGIYPPGAVVPISAEALSGRVFEAWTGGDGGTFADPTMAFTTFTMPPNAATITATYLPGPINPIGYAYPVLGHFGTWSGVGSVTATVDADHTQFARLTLGGSVVAPANYSIAGGSTKITLNSAYLSGLANGTYQFVAEYVAYPSGPIQLVVKRGGGGPADPGATDAPGAKSDGMPFTGTGLPAWVILLALALVGVGMRLTRVAYVKARSRT